MIKPSDPRAAVADALLALEQATSLQHNALERLGIARNELFEAPLLGGRREPPNEEHAASYQATANMLRRRATRQEADDKASTLSRASWFERRAEIKRAGGVMPRDLRTPGERLGFVDGLRQALLLVAEACDQIDPDDVSTFVRRLVDEEEEPLHGDVTEEAAMLARDAVTQIAAQLPALLEQLGLGHTADGAPGFWPAPQPLVEEDPTPATPPAQNNQDGPDVA